MTDKKEKQTCQICGAKIDTPDFCLNCFKNNLINKEGGEAFRHPEQIYGLDPSRFEPAHGESMGETIEPKDMEEK